MSVLSVIVPCFNEEKALPYFCEEICTVAEKLKKEKDLSMEMWYVDDGSADGTLAYIKNLMEKDTRVHYVAFSRNFGKEAAIYAGLQACTGDYVALLDADLQDPPALLEQMFTLVASGAYDCAATRRVNRKGEPPIRSFFARCFYKLMSKISKTDIVDGARDFRLMARPVVDAILSMGEYNRFSKGIFGWVGFKTKWLEFENTERVAGETKWSFWKLFCYSLDGIVAFSTVPLAIASIAGMLFCFIAFVMIIFIIIKTLVWGDPTSGWPSLACIIFLVSGVQLFSIGVLGQYMSKMYMETKHRPVYIAKEKK